MNQNTSLHPTPAEITDALKKYGFEDLPSSSYRILHFREGQTIVNQEDSLVWIGIILYGKAKICSFVPNGKHLILNYFISQGIIGDLELLSNESEITTTVIALSDFCCIAIDKNICLHELDRNITFLKMMATSMARNLKLSSENYTSSSLCTGEERLCRYILAASSKNVFHELLIDVSYSIGISYRHTLRLMDKLCRENILEHHTDGYHIIDKELLSDRAHSII